MLSTQLQYQTLRFSYKISDILTINHDPSTIDDDREGCVEIRMEPGWWKGGRRSISIRRKGLHNREPFLPII